MVLVVPELTGPVLKLPVALLFIFTTMQTSRKFPSPRSTPKIELLGP